MDRKVRVVVDTREPRDVLPGYPRQKLEYGDFLAGRCIIERKSIKDLWSSLITGRLDKQLIGLVKYAEDHNLIPVLLVHGDPYQLWKRGDRGTGRELAAGVLASVLVRYGVQVVWVPYLRDAETLVLKLAEKSIDHNGKPRRWIKLRDDKVEQFAGWLGVPTRVAREILLRGGIRFLVEANEGALAQIPGVGPKRAAQIMERVREWTLLE